MRSTEFPYPRPVDGGVLIASGNAEMRQLFVRLMEEKRWPTIEASGGADALEKLESSECRVLVLDEHLPDLCADEVAALIANRYPGVDVLTVGNAGLMATRCELKTELACYLLRALSPETVGDEPRSAPLDPPLSGMLGECAAMRAIYRAARRVASRNTSVLLLGESGTGKELVARAIRGLSSRADKPLITVNCAAIPESLLESELFGYVRGAFTGAGQSHIGRIPAANGGTLFLDEIGDMPIGLQPKILRFLEQGEIHRLGSAEVVHVDVRVIAASNADLEQKVAEQQFRKDLLYRLAVFPILLPPLRERGSDLPELARHFLGELAGPYAVFSEAAMRILEAHDWPGNVRELRHVVERACILAGGAARIMPEHIQLRMCSGTS